MKYRYRSVASRYENEFKVYDSYKFLCTRMQIAVRVDGDYHNTDLLY